jgi:hypothetical protein
MIEWGVVHTKLKATMQFEEMTLQGSEVHPVKSVGSIYRFTEGAARVSGHLGNRVYSWCDQGCGHEIH